MRARHGLLTSLRGGWFYAVFVLCFAASVSVNVSLFVSHNYLHCQPPAGLPAATATAPTRQHACRNSSSSSAAAAAAATPAAAPILTGCHHVFLDVGANIGVNIRKLFEPEKYPNATIAKHKNFMRLMGTPQQRAQPGALCAFGFEANKRHAKRLARLAACYATKGWRVLFLPFAVDSVDNVEVDFLCARLRAARKHMATDPRNTRSEDRDPANQNWASSTTRLAGFHSNAKPSKVLTLSLAKFVNEIVAPRAIALTPSLGEPHVWMKLDIEGNEYQVLANLLVTGALQHITMANFETHSWIFGNDTARVGANAQFLDAFFTLLKMKKRFLGASLTKFERWNDERDRHDVVPLPCE
jgi:hypothetical protein